MTLFIVRFLSLSIHRYAFCSFLVFIAAAIAYLSSSSRPSLHFTIHLSFTSLVHSIYSMPAMFTNSTKSTIHILFYLRWSFFSKNHLSPLLPSNSRISLSFLYYFSRAVCLSLPPLPFSLFLFFPFRSLSPPWVTCSICLCISEQHTYSLLFFTCVCA